MFPINFQTIEYLIALAQIKNFSKTAELLNITQPAFSRVIAKAEDEIGFKIFDRNNKVVSLTPSGVSFIDTICQIHAVYESGLNYSRKIADEKRQLVIGLGANFVGMPLMKKYMAFDSAHLDIDMDVVTMHSEEILPQIKNGHLDLGFLFNGFKEEETELNTMILAQIPLNVIVSEYNELSKKDIVETKDLVGQTFLALPVKGEAYNVGSFGNPYELINEKHHLNLNPSYVGHNIQDILVRVACNKGIAFFSETLAGLLPKGVKMLPLKDGVDFYLKVVWNGGVRNDVRDEFISLLDIGEEKYYFK